MPFPRDNSVGLIAFVLSASLLAFAAVEAFDTVIYTNWLRANIHWFTPALPAVMVAIALARKESKVPITLAVLLMAIQYGLLGTLAAIGRAGADVLRLL